MTEQQVKQILADAKVFYGALDGDSFADMERAGERISNDAIFIAAVTSAKLDEVLQQLRLQGGKR